MRNIGFADRRHLTSWELDRGMSHAKQVRSESLRELGKEAWSWIISHLSLPHAHHGKPHPA